MKLLRLKLNDKFRSLQPGFEIPFLREWDFEKAAEFNPYCLVGRNGSGKSNLLEALAAIFYHIECIYLDYRPDGFEADENNTNGFCAEKCYPNSFELEYLIPVPMGLIKRSISDLSDKKLRDYNAHIKIVKEKESTPKIVWLNREEFNESTSVELSRSEVKQLLPRFIVGYSSGENEILSLPFFKMRFIHFDEYRDKLTKQLDYIKPEGRLVFLDAQFSQAIVLSNFLLQPQHILKPFEVEIGLEYISQFRIIIRKHHQLDIHEELYQSLSDKEKKEEKITKIELTSKLMSLGS